MSDDSVVLQSPSSAATGFGSFKSTVHDVSVNLDDLSKFIKERCTAKTLAELRAMKFYEDHRLALDFMIGGEDLFESTVPEVTTLADIARRGFLSVPWNTQFVEQGAKEGDNAKCTNRTEGALSEISVARSGLIGPSNEILREEAKNRILRGNQYMTAGKQGERHSRTDETKTDDVDKRLEIVGKFKVTQFVKHGKEAAKDWEEFGDEDKSKINTIEKGMANSSARYSAKMSKGSVNQFGRARGRAGRKQRQKNKLQERKQVLHTSITAGRVRYSELSAALIDLVKEELRVRGVRFRLARKSQSFNNC